MVADQDVFFRHSGWLRDRRRVHTALTTVFPGSTREDRFRNCGSNAWVVRNEQDPTAWAVVSDHCHDRFCRPCAAFRGRTIASNVADHLQDRQYRFLTLTIKTTDLTLKQGVDKLYRSFAALRRTKIWLDKVVGGCAVCEVKPKDGTDGWHPHLHAIIEGRFLPLKLIRKHWLRITGDSFIVDIAIGRDAASAARYVSKYITKPFDNDTTRRPHRLIEAIKALHGRRLVSTFGNWRGQRLTEHQPNGTWIRVGTLGQLRQRAQNGDDFALNLLTYLYDSQSHTGFPTPTERGPPTLFDDG